MKCTPILSTKSLGIILAIAWILSPIGMMAMWFMTVGWDELSAASILVSAVFVTPLTLGTGYYGFRLLSDKSIEEKCLWLILPLLLVAWFVYKNVIPYRVFLAAGENDSPFDKIWYFWPQTAYGYPIPVVRIFDRKLPVEPFTSSLIDLQSIFYNVWGLSGGLFILFVITAALRSWCSFKHWGTPSPSKQ